MILSKASNLKKRKPNWESLRKAQNYEVLSRREEKLIKIIWSFSHFSLMPEQQRKREGKILN